VIVSFKTWNRKTPNVHYIFVLKARAGGIKIVKREEDNY